MPCHSVIFLGKDEKGKNRYAAYRSTGEERILGECSGSDKRFSLRLGPGNSGKVHLFESAIDLLSYATLILRRGGDYHKFDLLSLGGVYVSQRNDKPYKLPIALDYYLKRHPQVNTVYLHLDADPAGWQAAAGIKSILQDKLSGEISVGHRKEHGCHPLLRGTRFSPHKHKEVRGRNDRISCNDGTISKSQNVISIQTPGVKGGRSKPIKAFTEAGIYMLMTVLKGELAIEQSKILIRLFKRMKDYLIENQPLISQKSYIALVEKVCL